MHDNYRLYRDICTIYGQASCQHEPERCMVAPSPDLNDRIRVALAALEQQPNTWGALKLRAAEPRRDGFNDGLIIPPSEFPLGTSASVIRNVALERAPLSGTVRVIVVLVDFSDKAMVKTKQHFQDLFFSTGVIPTKSVHEYYTDVSNGLIDLRGDVVGPFKLPQTLAAYTHGASGTGNALPNARTMAADALAAADASVNFAPYDNDGNGYVDAFIVIHAGSGAEQTGSANDIWSHKWTLGSGAVSTDGTKVYGYLTVPEDSRIGVCAHELGHLLFGFPDLYDTDGSSEGIGNFCLMAAGSWGGNGDTPVHPSAWCKVNQGWATVDNVTSNGVKSISDVKDAHSVLRLWKDGASGSEYFLVENRQKTGFDATLPGGGLLVWHIDETVAGNTNEAHYKIALVQADNKKDLEAAHNRGDDGDPYPGTSGNSTFSNNSSPNSMSYAAQNTCVSLTSISAPASVMTANVTVKCGLKTKELKLEKPIFDKKLDKKFEKPIDKPISDKSVGFDKNFDKKNEKIPDKILDGKTGEKLGEGGGRLAESDQGSYLESRLAQLEAIVGGLLGSAAAGGGASAQPFIGAELRPDLSGGALSEEDDTLLEQMRRGIPSGKRGFDTKSRDN